MTASLAAATSVALSPETMTLRPFDVKPAAWATATS